MSKSQTAQLEAGVKTWREKLPTCIAVTTLVLAVCATLASFKAAGYGNKMVLAQNQASDQWAFYQAKSIRETSYQLEKNQLEIMAKQFGQPELYREKIEAYNQEITRYRQEKSEIQQEAKQMEALRDSAQGFNALFGQSLIFLQVGILLSSLASINKVHYYWFMGAGSGGIGVVMFIYALAKSW